LPAFHRRSFYEELSLKGRNATAASAVKELGMA
jgi:hypothetical protein